MQTTTNYALKKPEANDFINIADINYNTDLIDQKLKENATNVANLTPTKITDLVSTTKAIASISNNQIYELGIITNLTVSAFDANFSDAYLSFKSGTSFDCTFPEGTLFSGNYGYRTTFFALPDTIYEMSIRKVNNKVIVLVSGVSDYD